MPAVMDINSIIPLLPKSPISKPMAALSPERSEDILPTCNASAMAAAAFNKSIFTDRTAKGEDTIYYEDHGN